MPNSSMTRRGFLGTSAAIGLAAIAAGSPVVGLVKNAEKAHADEAAAGETRIVRTLCKGCTGNCGVLAHVVNGRVVKLEGDPDHIYSKGALCSKGLSYIQALYNPNRIKYPLRRVGERGQNQWERISWDEALDEIADQLIEGKAKYGAECLAIGSGGGGHPYLAAIPDRFRNVYGSPNSFEPGGLQCWLPRLEMSYLMWGERSTDFVAWEQPEVNLNHVKGAKSMVLWGSNPAQSSIGQSGQPMVEIRSSGVKTVVIDPRFTPDASKADIWLPIRPQTDVALAMCWIKYIIDHDLWDKETVYEWSNLPFLVSSETKMCLKAEDIGMEGDEYTYVAWDKNTNSPQPMPLVYNHDLDPALTGGPFVVNGIECTPAFQLLKERCDEWTLEHAAEVCWLEADMIEEAIKLYTENMPSSLCTGMASDHNPLGSQFGMAAVILETIMGNYNKPGNAAQYYNYGDSVYSFDPGKLQHFMPKEQYLKRFGMIEHKAMNNYEYCHNYLLQEAMLTGEPYQPRIIIERSGNKMTNMPNAVRWAQAVEKMDYVVHMYMYPTSFSAYSDLLLPATEWLEMYKTTQIASRWYVRQPATHLWEALDEPTFWGLLAKKMAAKGDQQFIDSMDPEKCAVNENTLPEGFVKSISSSGQIPWWSSTEEMLDLEFASRGGDMTWKELVAYCDEHGYYADISDEDHIIYDYHKKIDPETGQPNGFFTASKRIEMYNDAVITLGRTGAPMSYYELPPVEPEYDALPYYREPEEGPSNPEYDDFPLMMTGGHIARYTHCTMRNVPWQRECYPVPELSINPVDAEKYGIADGDWTWVESKRGKIQGYAYVTQAVRPGVVHMERFWFPETLNTETHGFTEMNVNVLTQDGPPFGDIIGTCTYRGFMVKVSKADKPPAGIWLEPEQFEPWLPNYDDAEITDYDEIVGGVNVD